MDEKTLLLSHLQARRRDVRAKIDGLDDYDVRRPMTSTGTNLLGLLKHVSGTQLGYFSEVFARPSGFDMSWMDDDAAPDADMFAAAHESRADIVELYEFSNAHTDATVAALPLDAVGQVPWWPPERRRVTLRQILMHMSVETARHAGHADIVRELIDGSVGNGPQDPNIPARTPQAWAEYCTMLEAVARAAR